MSKESSFPRHRVFRLLLLLFLLSLPAGCAGPDTSRSERDAAVPVHVLALAPFQVVSPGDSSELYVRCPLDGRTFRAGVTAKNPEAILEDLFLEKISSIPGLRLIPPGEAEETYGRICAASSAEHPGENLEKLGTALDADGVLFGYIYRFRERVGTPFSVEEPASVAFSVHLFNVPRKETTWNGAFDKTQTSLMENLLDVKTFFSAKGKWMTAEQLAREGVHRVMITFPAPGGS